MRILKTKLLDIEREKQESAEREARRSQVKSGDRSEKIRTYNFPQDRVADHRIGLTRHNLQKFMDGDIQDVIDALRATTKPSCSKARPGFCRLAAAPRRATKKCLVNHRRGGNANNHAAEGDRLTDLDGDGLASSDAVAVDGGAVV